MGFEYKIICSIPPEKRQELEEVIQMSIDQNQEYAYEVLLKFYGLYICVFKSPKIWDEIPWLQDYLQESGVEFRLKEL